MGLIRRRTDTFFYLLFLCLLFGLMLTAFNVYELSSMKNAESGNGKVVDNQKYLAWIHADHLNSGYLNHLIDVLDRVGYTYTTNGDGDWDLLWSHNYPFTDLAITQLQKLKSYQKVNHFPGSGFITNKASLVSTHIPAIPLAFQIPKDKNAFLEEAKTHPEKLWVVKSNGHRGIAVKHPNEIELDVTESNSFIQEFIKNPLLINGRMFDIGVYTVMTSVNPLRVYIFTADVLIRFCTKDYHPFDANDLKKYVVGDDYTPPREIPGFKEIYLKGKFSRLETLRLYLRKQGEDDTKMWNSIKNTISEVYQLKENNFIAASAGFRSSRNFFEMVRFDFILDDNLKAWLLEVNMSPNLSSAAHNHNKLMYEKVIFNLLTLTGVSHFTRKPTKDSSSEEFEMRVSDDDIQVNAVCASEKCLKSCYSEECELCNSCLEKDEREFLKMAYLEHLHRRTYRRVYPPPMTQETARALSKDMTSLKTLSRPNHVMRTWFIHKCLHDATWCS
ncbi:tubulin polyglutamylase TTLL6-like isoform X1 [Paramuricea clavata]|uniref:Tubulin polyglutamylase TTLL6-like isoform X1 n=1 Tax=Paramuricea clavata TaxID=317549 RepID=A0A6S7G7A8_PARCT|nr:tubulin polyglutamylase TTLL6-like isoform X1 [Paramuricea clavata]